MAQKRYHPPIYWLGPTTWFPVEHCLVNNEPHKTVAASQHNLAKCQESRVITCASFDTGNNQENAMINDPPETPKQATPVDSPIPPPSRFTRADWMVVAVIVIVSAMVWLVR